MYWGGGATELVLLLSFGCWASSPDHYAEIVSADESVICGTEAAAMAAGAVGGALRAMSWDSSDVLIVSDLWRLRNRELGLIVVESSDHVCGVLCTGCELPIYEANSEPGGGTGSDESVVIVRSYAG